MVATSRLFDPDLIFYWHILLKANLLPRDYVADLCKRILQNAMMLLISLFALS